ncbi:UbiA prenyltransferase [Pyrolobus fumarii 1A]|uniref:Protoheme IX farnesyltransferase n=1 Tax=Pyrolobus fumarii (strain DSM 11204 / 1A) TaxID=694429 RepID=G0EHP2_PYRF1|nr:protoheme IX farnesyltransferase [Pyrolobus fumarii]AEM39395.1 UbiA prenyltransferase [Pyrolobus fumarii 1A]
MAIAVSCCKLEMRLMLARLGGHLAIVEALKLTKPLQTMMLLVGMYAGFYAGGGIVKPLWFHILIGLLGFLAIAATTAVNMVYDVDIDSIMERTRNRPLPRGVFSRQRVLILATITIVLTAITSCILVNVYYAAAIVIGYLSDIYAYTLLTKRHTWLSVFAGSIAGASPAVGGYAAARGYVDVDGLLIGALIVAWIPAHIWSLVIHYDEDYRRARIPMLPVIKGYRVGVVGSTLSIVLTVAIATAIYVRGLMSPEFYIAGVAAGSAAVLMLLRRCRPGSCIKTFRVVNMVLMLFLLGAVLSSIL